MLAKIKTDEPVWLRGAKGSSDLFLPAKVTNVQQAGARVTVEKPDKSTEVLDRNKADVFPANPTGTKASDHCALIHLNEPCILENTRQRYARDLIYTYTGRILVAVNPFRELDDIYSAEMVEAFATGSTSASTPPQVFAVAERAYVRLRRAGKSQVVVMSGESGAGKTETAKLCMSCLVEISESSGSSTQSALESAALLEAFGNARTVHNSNSSRFGRWCSVHFDHKRIRTCKIQARAEEGLYPGPAIEARERGSARRTPAARPHRTVPSQATRPHPHRAGPVRRRSTC